METASRFTRDTVTTTLVTGSDIPDGVKRLVTGKLKNFKLYFDEKKLGSFLGNFYRLILGDDLPVIA
ncbi:hypothetical protein Tco_0976587 [Tanacetum coccineum]|uniref:Uncharacterized protein n=1 Tax=Tanacetum coccineum TaxID=301880 RepID=A0ABQ5EHN3_9ASTR